MYIKMTFFHSIFSCWFYQTNMERERQTTRVKGQFISIVFANQYRKQHNEHYEYIYTG